MQWYQEDEYEDEEEDLMFSPALLARRASESWIVAPPVEVHIGFDAFNCIFSHTLFVLIHQNKSQIINKMSIFSTN